MQLSIRKSLLVGLPIAVVALALFVMSMGNGVMKAHAAVDPTVNFSISSPGCSSSGTPTAKCNVNNGSTFVVAFNLLSLPSNVGGSYAGYDANITYTAGLATGAAAPKGISQTGAGNWDECVFNASDFTTAGTVAAGCGIGIGAPESTDLGALFHVTFTCVTDNSTQTIALQHGDGKTDIVEGPALTSHSEAAVPAHEDLTINCVPQPTATPVPPTATPPPQPRVAKSCVPSKGFGHVGPAGSLCNDFLVREGAKIPPVRCEDANNGVTMNEGINIPITSQDPKGLTGFQQLAAFEFEVRFDAKMVCVSISPGPAWGGLNVLCSSLVSKGIVRFGCVSIKKGNNLNGSVPAQPLAIIRIRPQPEIFSQLRPNQDNGIPVQILNQGCQLSDEQGHTIPIFSCEDADITFRYLEGDVDGPDCDVDVLDAQQVAFRWGAVKGTLLYNSFMDLMPSGQVKGDGRIDIHDLQFVFGRLNSNCQVPWPPQPAVNPKA